MNQSPPQSSIEPARGLSIVVPVYNAELNLSALPPRIIAAVGHTSAALEIILVNDGSRDGSWETIARLADRDPRVHGINLYRNYGQHNALLAGIRAAQFDTLVTMDDDLQNPPEEIPKLIERLEEGYDVVYGTPDEQQHGLMRDLASSITKFALQGAMGAETARSVSAFRVFRTSLRRAFAEYNGPYVSIDVLLTWGTNRFSSVVVHHEPRHVGVSNYNVAMLIVHALNMVTGFSTRPLRIASVIGFSLTLFGAFLLAFVLIRYAIEPGVVPGFALLATALTIFSGAQLFCLGIIGEYLARIHFRTMDKPPYAIRECTVNQGGAGVS